MSAETQTLTTPSPLEGEVGSARRALSGGGACAKRTNKKLTNAERFVALPDVPAHAATSPHPGPPPQGGRGYLASGCATGARR
jgi:hypothetical protein